MDPLVSLNGNFALFQKKFILTNNLYSPIGPGQNLTYEFVVAQHGSYWIHSHFMVCTYQKIFFKN